MTAGWRVAARLARREVRRRPGRSALVTALVAVPVAGMLVGVAYQRTDELSAAESWHFLHGRADATLDYQPGIPFPSLPEGGRFLDVHTTERVAVAETRLCRCELTDVPDDPIADGMVHVTEGRMPRDADEVVLSGPAARRLGVGLGDRLELNQPVDVDATVVGLSDPRLWGTDELIVVGPGVDLGEGYHVRLVDLPDVLTADQVAAWESTAGPHAMSPAFDGAFAPWISTENHNVEVRWTLVFGAIGLTVLGIVVAAAFAAGARRQMATLGQLAANGATPAALRRVVFLQGTVTGLIGTAVGLALGAAVLAALRPRASELLDQTVLSWEVRLLDVLPIVAVAVVAATLAAVVPARGASRVSVLSALAGRRPLGRVSRHHTAVGLVVAATGLGCLGAVAWAGRDGVNSGSVGPLSLVAVAGPVLLLLGMCAAAPAYVTVLQPVATLTRGPWRLAARSLFRQRTRTSALVAAIAAISALALATAGVSLGIERSTRDERIRDQLPTDVVRVQAGRWLADLVREAPAPGALDTAVTGADRIVPGAERFALSEAMLPGSTVVPSSVVWEPFGSGGEVGGMPDAITVADDQFRRAFDLDAATEQALDRHGAVWTGDAGGDAAADHDGLVRVEATTYAPPTDPAVLAGNAEPPVVAITEFEAAPLDTGHALGLAYSGELLVTPERAEELGFDVVATGVALRSPDPLTGEQLDDLDQLALALEAVSDDVLATSAPGTADPAWVRLDFHEPSFVATPAFLEAVPSAVALLFTLFVVAAGLALAATETRDERATLTVLGAAPRTIRRTSATKAFLLTLLGGLLAVPLGLLPVHVYTWIDGSGTTVPTPWRTVVALVVAVPLAAALAAALASRAGARWGRTAPVGGGAVV